MRKKWRFITGFVLILILTILLFWGYIFNGFTWSSKHIRFEQILCALPYPPGIVNPCSDKDDQLRLYGAPENCFLEDSYIIDLEHEEVINFYETQLSTLGWSISNEKEPTGWSTLDTHTYYTSTEILFTSIQRHWITHQPYWLWVQIITRVNLEENSLIDTTVTVSISNDQNCFAHHFTSDD